MSLGTAPLPPLSDADRVRGPEGAPLVVAYLDYACADCRLADARLRALPLRVCVRVFPLGARDPRSRPAALAAEAAAMQGAFWAFHDALFDHPGRLEDPDLWNHAERLGLDVAQFERDRRSDAAERAVSDTFRAGVRAGVATTPTLFADGEAHFGEAWRGFLARYDGAVRKRM